MEYRGFNSRLKELVSSNIFLYKLWFYSIKRWRSGRSRLPSTTDDWYFDGYPRSGNTFFTHLFKKMFPQKKFAHHLHMIAGIKIALKSELPVFIIIRNPKDAVVSNLYREVTSKNQLLSSNLIERLLISYYNYYTFIQENLESISVLNFNACIKNELLAIKEVAEKAGFEINSEDLLHQNLQSYKTMMKKKEVEKDSYASSLPNEQREKFKEEYMSRVLNSSSYDMAESIYKKVVKYDLLTGSLAKSDKSKNEVYYESPSN